MKNDFNEKAPNVPTEPRALKRLKRYIELEDFGNFQMDGIPNVPRYLVTYMNSNRRPNPISDGGVRYEPVRHNQSSLRLIF